VPLFTSGGLGLACCYFGLGLKKLVLFTSQLIVAATAPATRLQCSQQSPRGLY